jgi:hypothetical protein
LFVFEYLIALSKKKKKKKDNDLQNQYTGQREAIQNLKSKMNRARSGMDQREVHLTISIGLRKPKVEIRKGAHVNTATKAHKAFGNRKATSECQQRDGFKSKSKFEKTKSRQHKQP